MNPVFALPALSTLAMMLSAAAAPPVPTRLGTPAAMVSAVMPQVAASQPVPTVSRRATHRRRTASRALGTLAAANRAATLEPGRQGFINAVQVYPYGEGLLFQVYTAPERITDIALQAGEALVAVASGDTVRWVIGDTTSGTGADKRTHVLVKPFAAGLATNLVITTDRRSYHLALTSTGGAAMAGLSWSYSQDALIALKRSAEDAVGGAPVAIGLDVDRLRFDYAISGDKPAWRPLRAFDDGRQTFIEFPASLAVGEAPPLFLVARKGEAQLVNYRLRGRYYVVDRLFDAAELRLGTRHQDVVRIDRVGARRQRRAS
ncbi:P-type conjugative transfer protein TrbG [Sphingomonas paeninsulae]|nr:P-type conjugative transfer protein TrbG [Sphingomonas paeninsulae]